MTTSREGNLLFRVNMEDRKHILHLVVTKDTIMHSAGSGGKEKKKRDFSFGLFWNSVIYIDRQKYF